MTGDRTAPVIFSTRKVIEYRLGEIGVTQRYNNGRLGQRGRRRVTGSASNTNSNGRSSSNSSGGGTAWRFTWRYTAVGTRCARPRSYPSARRHSSSSPSCSSASFSGSIRSEAPRCRSRGGGWTSSSPSTPLWGAARGANDGTSLCEVAVRAPPSQVDSSVPLFLAELSSASPTDHSTLTPSRFSSVGPSDASERIRQRRTFRRVERAVDVDPLYTTISGRGSTLTPSSGSAFQSHPSTSIPTTISREARRALAMLLTPPTRSTWQIR